MSGPSSSSNVSSGLGQLIQAIENDLSSPMQQSVQPSPLAGRASLHPNPQPFPYRPSTRPPGQTQPGPLTKVALFLSRGQPGEGINRLSYCMGLSRSKNYAELQKEAEFGIAHHPEMKDVFMVYLIAALFSQQQFAECERQTRLGLNIDITQKGKEMNAFSYFRIHLSACLLKQDKYFAEAEEHARKAIEKTTLFDPTVYKFYLPLIDAIIRQGKDATLEIDAFKSLNPSDELREGLRQILAKRKGPPEGEAQSSSAKKTKGT